MMPMTAINKYSSNCELLDCDLKFDLGNADLERL